MVDYSELHERTKAIVPKRDGLKKSAYWASILRPEVKPEGPKKDEDYLWIKCTGKTTVSQVQSAWKFSGDGEDFVLAHNGVVISHQSDTPMRSLNSHGDQVVVLEAIHITDVASRIQIRAPLQNSNAQVSAPAMSSTPSESGLDSSTPVVKPRSSKSEASLKPSERATQNENSVAAFAPYPFGLSTPEIGRLSFQGTDSFRIATPGAESNMAMSNTPSRSQNSPLPVRSGSSVAGTAVGRGVTALDESDAANSSTNVYHHGPTTTTPPHNLPFLKYLDHYKGVNQSMRHYSASYVFEVAWSSWERMPECERAQYEKLAIKEACGSHSPGSEVFYMHAFQDTKPDAPSDPNPDALVEETIKPELNFEDQFHQDDASQQLAEPTQVTKSFQLHDCLADASLEVLENSIEEGVKLLGRLKDQVNERAESSADARQWIQQIDKLQSQATKTRTIIGVVGNTGAGKSSVINAMLDEERLVPTNTMRACTAVVTELSYNYTDHAYRAEVEFITAEEWMKELEILFDDLIDSNGQVSKEYSDENSDAGVAYAKIKAVYPRLTKDDICRSNPTKLLDRVANTLGNTRLIAENDSLMFYRRLQHFVDSKEKNTGKGNDKDKKNEPREMEFWPLIKVVRIFVKSPALATGAVIVDLPGVHDANAARAAVAEGYMKQCTGLWIVAPIIRAVDDKAAKNLLGESFKRQLKMDGGFDSVTFICSKTDDISLMEASDSLGLDGQNAPLWDELDQHEKTQKSLKDEIAELQDTKETYGQAMADCDDQLEIWEELKSALEDGNTVYAPSDKKRKRSAGHCEHKKQKRSQEDSDGSDNDFIGDEESDRVENGGSEDDDLDEALAKAPVTEEEISAKITEIRNTKKAARRQRTILDEQLRSLRKQINQSKQAAASIEANISRVCIEGRNNYSKGAIQQDFAAGMKELDQELAAEEDEDNFNPDIDARDYDEVARSLPVFCVSSRGYQKLRGRLRKDADVSGFTTADQTEVPALQEHCKQLTVAGRTAACRRFMTNLSQLLNSMTLWASNDGSGANLTADQRKKEARFLTKSLEKLKSCLENLVESTRKELGEEVSGNIIDRFAVAVANAEEAAAPTCIHWGAPVDRGDRANGGYLWATYKAICRRNGVYSNAQGPHDFNGQLVDPMMKQIASGWERTFTRRMPAVTATLSRNASNLLKTFHRDVNARAQMTGAGIAGLSMLQQQLTNYEDIFQGLSVTIKEMINKQQKEINRGFVPVIIDIMTPGYEACVYERGPGSFMRMKAAMIEHVGDQKAVMFQRSCDSVKEQLKLVLGKAEEAMANKANEVFVALSRDYHSVLGNGEMLSGETMPKWQRDMRKSVMQVLSTAEHIFVNAASGIKEELEEEEEKKTEEGKQEMDSDHRDAEPKREDMEDFKMEEAGTAQGTEE